jgi:hypothetical protein
VINDEITIKINQWNCEYRGKLSRNSDQLVGRFDCKGEKPDSVSLNRISLNSVFGLFKVNEFCLNGSDSICLNAEPDNEISNIKCLDSAGTDENILSKIDEEITYGKYGKIHSFLLFKCDKLIFEKYYYGFHKNVLHPLESATKSVISLLIGLLYDQGKFKDLSDSVSKYLSTDQNIISNNVQKTNLHQLLTMTSGITCDQNKLLFSKNREEFLLSCTKSEESGTQFEYQNWNTEMLGLIIKFTSGLYADDFAHENLFFPLGIVRYKWDIFKNKGYPLCGGSLWLRPRDMGKIGLLVLNRGIWQGKRLISEEWITASVTGHIQTGIDNDKYGYQWWISEITSGKSAYRLIWANGLGSQFIFIFPDLDMVMVTTGGNWTGRYEERSWDIFKLLQSYLCKLDGGEG